MGINRHSIIGLIIIKMKYSFCMSKTEKLTAIEIKSPETCNSNFLKSSKYFQKNLF